VNTDINLPPELESAVRASAANAAALVPDRTAVYARARKIRRRTAAVRAITAGVVALALGASFPFVHARLGPEITGGGLAGGQPIGLWQNRDAPPVTEGIPSGVHVPGSAGEIAAQLRTVDGRNVVVPVSDPPPGMSGTYLGPVPLDGGGLATIGVVATSDINSIGKMTVVVLDAAGRRVSSRPAPVIRSWMSRPMPMTGNATTLFWWAFEQTGKPGQEHVWPVLNRYDIRTGRLAELAPAVGGDGYQLPYFGMQATTARIINWPAVGGQTCSADIADAGTGERVSVLTTGRQRLQRRLFRALPGQPASRGSGDLPHPEHLDAARTRPRRAHRPDPQGSPDTGPRGRHRPQQAGQRPRLAGDQDHPVRPGQPGRRRPDPAPDPAVRAASGAPRAAPTPTRTRGRPWSTSVCAGGAQGT
jgi:hypothetical protein